MENDQRFEASLPLPPPPRPAAPAASTATLRIEGEDSKASTSPLPPRSESNVVEESPSQEKQSSRVYWTEEEGDLVIRLANELPPPIDWNAVLKEYAHIFHPCRTFRAVDAFLHRHRRRQMALSGSKTLSSHGVSPSSVSSSPSTPTARTLRTPPPFFSLPSKKNSTLMPASSSSSSSSLSPHRRDEKLTRRSHISGTSAHRERLMQQKFICKKSLPDFLPIMPPVLISKSEMAKKSGDPFKRRVSMKRRVEDPLMSDSERVMNRYIFEPMMERASGGDSGRPVPHEILHSGPPYVQSDFRSRCYRPHCRDLGFEKEEYLYGPVVSLRAFEALRNRRLGRVMVAQRLSVLPDFDTEVASLLRASNSEDYASQFPLSGSDFVREFPRKSSENFVDNQACIDEFYRDIAELELDLTYQRMMGPNEPLSSTYLGYNLAYELRLPHPPLVRRSEEESRDRSMGRRIHAALRGDTCVFFLDADEVVFGRGRKRGSIDDAYAEFSYIDLSPEITMRFVTDIDHEETKISTSSSRDDGLLDRDGGYLDGMDSGSKTSRSSKHGNSETRPQSHLERVRLLNFRTVSRNHFIIRRRNPPPESSFSSTEDEKDVSNTSSNSSPISLYEIFVIGKNPVVVNGVPVSQNSTHPLFHSVLVEFGGLSFVFDTCEEWNPCSALCRDLVLSSFTDLEEPMLKRRRKGLSHPTLHEINSFSVLPPGPFVVERPSL